MVTVNKELSAVKTNSRLYMSESEMEFFSCAIKVSTGKLMKVYKL